MSAPERAQERHQPCPKGAWLACAGAMQAQMHAAAGDGGGATSAGHHQGVWARRRGSADEIGHRLQELSVVGAAHH